MTTVVHVIVAMLVLLMGVPRWLHAQPPASHEVQAWLLLLAQQPVGQDWIVHGEVQPRLRDDLRDRDQLLLRGGLGRRLGSRTTAWAGYAYAPRRSGSSTLHEQRTWQQVNVALPGRVRWTPSIRLRQEQRYLEQWGDTSHRFRALARLVRPVGGSQWSLAIWDEWFVTLDETEAGPRRGYDQNRLFLTAARRLSTAVTFEGGYLWQHVPAGPGRTSRQGHTLFAWFTYAAPRK